MSTLSTHVLDTSLGKPAEGVRVTLSLDGNELGTAVTDADGRVRDLLGSGAQVDTGEYTLTFAVGNYFAGSGRGSFYRDIAVSFRVDADGGHYHVPLLLSPFGYSTYRGS